MGPVLSFDTYNEIFHFFSDPAIPGLPGLGYEGDYEFIFMGQENNELILKGKKTGNTFRMHPLSKNQSWEQTLNDLKSIIRTITPPDYYGYGLTVENTEIFLTQTGRALTTEPNGRNFEIDYIEGKDTRQSTPPLFIPPAVSNSTNRFRSAGKPCNTLIGPKSNVLWFVRTTT